MVNSLQSRNGISGSYSFAYEGSGFLNGHNFILTVVKSNKEHSEWPEYICTCESFYTTELSNSSTNAISTVYQQLFRTKTKFSGPMIMGFGKPTICEKLLEGVLFRSYFINLELIRVLYLKLQGLKMINGDMPELVLSQVFCFN